MPSAPGLSPRPRHPGLVEGGDVAREAGAGPWGQAWRARGWALHRQKGWQGHGSEDSAPAPVRPGLPPGCLWTKSVSFPRGRRSARRKELFCTRAQSRLEQDARHPRARLSLAAVQGVWAGRQGAPKLMDTPGKTFWAPRTGAAQGRALGGAGFRPRPQLDASPKCWRSPLPSPLPCASANTHWPPTLRPPERVAGGQRRAFSSKSPLFHVTSLGQGPLRPGLSPSSRPSSDPRLAFSAVGA